MIELNRLVVEKDKIIKKELFKKYFGFQGLIDMPRELYKTKKDKNKGLVNVTKSGLADLENKIKEMSEDETENERLYDIVNILFMLIMKPKKDED